MTGGFFPLGDPKADPNDPCRLCNTVGGLTRTHVPSRASGNRERGRPLGERVKPDGSRTLEFGKGPPGAGWWGWYFCDPCNRATGVWEQEHMRWQRALLEGVHPRGGSSRLLPPLELKDHDPGAFVRALWAWNFALDETLYGGHRDLAAAVRSGNATQPPSDLRLWIAATMSLDMWTLRVRDGYAVTTDLTQGGWQQRESGLWSQEPELIDLPRAVISAPPFIILLADAARDVPLFDTGPWLTEAAGSRRPVPVLLPTVEVHRRGERPVRYDDIVVLELQI